MIKRFAVLVISAFALKAFSAVPETPSVIRSYFDAMKELPNETSAARAYDLQIKMQHCFLYGNEDEQSKSNSGIEIPNDFYSFGYKERKKMSSTKYTQMFMQMAFSSNERLKVVDVKVKSSSYAQEVDLRKFLGESTPYIQTLVTRTFRLGNVKVTFNDTILTKNNLIYALNNGIGGDDSGDNLETLRALAARYYSMKQYRSAYQTYEKIIAIDNKNANAYYRLGVLAFWYGKKCGFYSTSRAQKKGREYMEIASRLRAIHAEQVLYYMLHPETI